MEVRQAAADRIAGNLRTLPLDGISDRGITEHAEVKSLVGVLPDVFGVYYEILAKRLLEAGMEFIAMARAQWNGVLARGNPGTGAR